MTVRSRHGTLRVIGLATTFLYGWWLITYFRTTSVGNDSLLTYLLIGFLYVLPVALLPLLGLQVRRSITIALAVVVLSITGALSWATIEEQMVMRSVSAESEYHGERWWPFTSHSIMYDPQDGWHGGE